MLTQPVPLYNLVKNIKPLWGEMMLTDELKNFIKSECNTQCVGISSVQDMTVKKIRI